MQIIADYHMHSCFSADSEEVTENMVKHAIELGLKQICFTEHIDEDYPGELDFTLDIPSYFAEVERLQKVYADKIKILHGVEMGITPHLAKRYYDITANNAFDFVIGSNHLVSGEDPYETDFWQGKDEDKVYTTYFNELLEDLRSFHDFDVCGHVDYIFRLGPTKNTRYKEYMDIIESILKTVLELGKGIEINSSGYHRGLNNPNPHWEIVKRYKELGGEIITIGSDAHRVAHQAHSFDIVADHLRELGFKYYTVFEKREKSFIKL